MSPRVLQEGGYRIAIFTHDHLPPHVHVKRGENGAKIQVDPVIVLANWGFNSRELGRIQQIIMEHQAELLGEWAKLHPGEEK